LPFRIKLKADLINSVLLSIIASVLITISFPPLSLWWLSFVGLIPFFFSLEKTASAKKSLICGFLFGVIHGAGMGYWLVKSLMESYDKSPGMAIFFLLLCICLPTGLLFSLFALSYRFFQKSGLFFYCLVVPSLWITTDLLKELIPVLIPWGSVGYCLTPFSEFIQIADLGGIYLITYLVLMINSLLYHLITLINQKKQLKTTTRRAYIFNISISITILLSAFLIPQQYGSFKISKYNAITEPESSLSATIVQGNFSQNDRWSGEGFYQRLQTYLKLSTPDENIDNISKNIVIWPETVLNSSNKLTNQLFARIIASIGKKTILVAGGLRNDSGSRNVYNTAYVISGEGLLQWYDKKILLPYAEKTPIPWLLGKYYNAPSTFLPGELPATISISSSIIGLSICFESLYPHHVRKTVSNGAKLLVNISNDAWFGKTSMPELHLNASCIRAIENRRYLLRASNSGFSAIISPLGRVNLKTDLFVQDAISAPITQLTQKSFYVKYGEWVAYLTALIILFSLIKIIYSE